MKRRYAVALSTLAFGWLGGQAPAEEPVYYQLRRQPVEVLVPHGTAAAPGNPPVNFVIRKQGKPEVAAAPTPKVSIAPVTTAIGRPGDRSGVLVTQVTPEAAPAPRERPTPPPPTPQTVVHAAQAPAAGATPAPAQPPLILVDSDLSDKVGGVYVFGLGLYIVQPHWENNPAYGARADSLTPTDNLSFSIQQDFSFEYDASPRLWMAYFGEDGFGIRTNWWHFNDGAFEAPGNLGNPAPLVFNLGSAASLGIPALPTTLGDALGIEAGLKVDIFDVELAQEVQLDRWLVLGSAGLRYAHIAQSYNAVLIRDPADLTLGPTDVDLVRTGHRFQGIGPTLAVEVRRPFGGNWSLYSTARGSLLYGNGKREAFAFITNPDVLTPPLTSSFNFIPASRDDVMPIGDIEIGLEWTTQWRGCGLFFQFGWVGQLWQNAGSSSSEDGNLSFTGLSLMAGVQR